MKTSFYTNYSEVKFIDRLKYNLDTCSAFWFSVSFIKKPGLKLLAPHIDAALARGVKGKLITSTYQNFTDIDSLVYFNSLATKFPGKFECHLDRESFCDLSGNTVGFHSKGYLFEFEDHNELMVGSSNITVYALLKNIEWDVAITAARTVDSERADIDDDTFNAAMEDFNHLWQNTLPLSHELIEEYKTHLYYSIERWDMDYNLANSDVKPNYMQRRALKELNRLRAMGSTKALVCAAAGSGKTYLAAFDALNFNPERLLYIVHEGSILLKTFDTFQRVFGSDQTYGIYNKDFKDYDANFVFSTNVTMAGSLELFDRHEWDYIIIDETHHATASTYKKIIDYFEPQFLLGITATPERMDGEDVFELFDHNVPYELRLRDAIVNGLVVPFKYYGIRDEFIEYGLKETKGYRFIEKYSDEDHCEFIYNAIEKHRPAGQKLKALAFCRDIAHARRMAQAMESYYGTEFLTGKNSIGERIRAYHNLQDENAETEILFTVDILNEGVDIPGVNMVLFLRPTESQTIFIQQLGRGLRKFEGKESVTVLDFIGNDYKRSVQIAFALGSLSRNFVVEKKLIAALVKDDFKSIGLADYGVEIHIDDLSKKEVLSFVDEVNFNTKRYLKQDYDNFKKYISAERYPDHVDYLNNDFAPDLVKFMQSKTSGRKNKSYYGFLAAIDEKNLPGFDDRQEAFVDYISEMLPIVRPYEYLMLQKMALNGGHESIKSIIYYTQINMDRYEQKAFDHALHYMRKEGFVEVCDDEIALKDVKYNADLDEYIKDLLEYGLGRYDIDHSDRKEGQIFDLWKPYRKEQVQQLLLKNPADIMLGTKIYDGIVYIYVTVVKADSVKSDLKYVDGYLDQITFQWETVAHISKKELESLKTSKCAHVFVRKIDSEDGIQLPFTYIGEGQMRFVPGSLKPNGAYHFHIQMAEEAPEDLYFDYRLRD